MNLRSEGTNPRARGTNPRAATTKEQPKQPVIITSAAELRDFLAQFRPKQGRRARIRAAAVAKKQWKRALANVERETNQALAHGGQ